MKNRLLFSLLALLMVFSSCKKDPCEGVNCLNGVCNEGVCICATGWSGEFCTIEDVDPCENVNCNNGTCVNGDCDCDAGYEGSDCGTAYNAKFVGTYTVFPENCNPSGPISIPYTISISSSAISPDRMSITGLWESPGEVASATIQTGGLAFDIARQDYHLGSFNTEIGGNGYINADASVVEVTYTIYDKATGDPLDACTSTATKQ